MPLFDRQYKLLVGKTGESKGVQIEQPFRITFDIEKTSGKEPNKSTIRIYNLASPTRAWMEKPDTRCLLYAGYKEDVGPLLIFSGSVTFAYTKFDGPDVITEFTLKDGQIEYRDTMISVGYGPGVTNKQIINDASKKMGLPLMMAKNLPERTWQNGFSFYGAARTLMDKAVAGSGLEWSIQNNNIQVIEKGMVTTRNGVVLSADSGLIGNPEKKNNAADEVAVTTTKKKSSKSKETTGKLKKKFDGWEVKSLLMPQLIPGDRVKLESRSVTGIWRIDELNHKGDSWGQDDWVTELKLIDPAAPISGDKKTKGGSTSKILEDEDIEE